MASNQKVDEILSSSPMAIRQDILLFKEEVLKDIRVATKEFSIKFTKMEDLLKEQINAYENKVINFEQRIMNLSNLISSDRTLVQKIDELIQFKDETRDKLITESIRITNVESDYKVNLKNIENVLSTSVIYPGLIGYSAKFKTFHDYMDYVLKQISDLNLFKEKSIMDLVPYKKKIDDGMEFIRLQVNHIINSSNEYTIKSVNESEQRMKSLIQLYDDRLQDTRVENAHYSIGLVKKSEELSRLISNVHDVKADIYKRLKDEVNNMKGDQRQVLRLFTGYKKQFNLIKDKFTQLSEFIRDVRFRANIAPDIKKREFVNMAKQLDFNHNINSLSNSISNNTTLNSRKGNILRSETFDLNKRMLPNTFENFELPSTEHKNKLYASTFGKNKRTSLQASLNSFSNNSKEDPKNYPYMKSKSKKGIYIDLEKDLDDTMVKKTFNRRNTAAVIAPKKLKRDFSENSSKNAYENQNNSPNNDFYNYRKEKEQEKQKQKEDNLAFSSETSSEEDNKENDDMEQNQRKISMQKENKKPKSQYVIKEEDENNISEISEDNKKQKSNDKEKQNENKEKSENDKNNNKNIQMNSQNNNSNKKEEKINDTEQSNNKDNIEKKDNKNIDNKKDNNKEKEMEKQRVKIIKNLSNENLISNIKNLKNKDNKKNNNIKIIKNDNKNIPKIINYYSKEKLIKYQDKVEIIDKNKKEPERNKTVSIININDMFMSKLNELNPYFNSTGSNFFIASSQENSLKKQKPVTARQHVISKNNPSIIKSNKIIIDSNSKNSIFNKKFNEDYENVNSLEKSNKAYKTYSNFPKTGLDNNPDRKPKISSKVIYLNNSKEKKGNEITNNFLNKKVKKVNLINDFSGSFK